jgi:TusA-related sulfurtransferase
VSAVRASIDIRGVACPLTWVRTRVALERLAAGEVLEVTLLAGEPLKNVPLTAQEEGHRLAASEPRPELGEGAWRILLVKGEGRASDEGGLLP